MAANLRNGWREVLIATAALVATVPARATTPDGPAAADELAAWARDVATPQLIDAYGSRDDSAAAILTGLLRSGAGQGVIHDPRFWNAAVDSRESTHLALAVRLVALATAGDTQSLEPYRPLIAQAAADTGVAPAILTELAARLPGDSAAPPASLLEVADLALDADQSDLAAFAYRLVLLNQSPDAYAYRDIAGHYFYCLHELGAAPDVQSTRAHFNATVVFPSVEAQSRARLEGAAAPTDALTAAD